MPTKKENIKFAAPSRETETFTLLCYKAGTTRSAAL